MKYDLKKSKEEILASFGKKIKMSVFSWNGDIDTVMSPRDSILYYKHFLRMGMMSIAPQTGFVKTWVGGINYKHFKYDQVIQGSRQTGSTFKPFVYAAAIDQLHYSPCDKFPDVQYCIEAGKYGNTASWCPKNSNGKFSGQLKTLKTALASSINTITTMLIDKVGPKPVINLTKKLGVTANIPSVPSIALGTADIKLSEMVAAYSTFANKGIYIKPIVVKKIKDRKGMSLYNYKPEIRDVFSHQVSYTILSLLKGVTQSGSGRRLRGHTRSGSNIYKKIVTDYPYNFEVPIAGKTGTTQNNSDGWFIGMGPDLVTGVWVGGEDRAIHFESTSYGQGASLALPIWAIFMKKCYKDETLNISQGDFEMPDKMSIKIDCLEKEGESDSDPSFRDFEF
ncbi:penicillin-binding protein 1A [Elysia marginata]|uniref:peptidoglycan glycosyltransferase n=1 Tax=Elysia marginata TaxID=1093978 RepID=A0AAV4F196_9GAST|nr:penicillin-binding protein 1A [Elysia marginata]